MGAKYKQLVASIVLVFALAHLSVAFAQGKGKAEYAGGTIASMYILLLAGVLFNGSLSAREGVIKYPLSVSDNGRFLLQSDGKPFFFLGCTAWQFFAELSREEGDAYMEDRRQKEFTVIQACAVGIGWGNPTHKEGNAYGDIPFNNNDVSQPKVTDGSDPDNAWQYDYWDNVDYLVKSAEEKGLVIAFLPTFSTTFNQGAVPSDAKAGAYGAFLGKRYKNSPNIIWVLGGDIKCQDVTSKVRAMAQGILSEDKNHLITYHPSQASSTCFHNDDWLDFNMIQTSHGSKDNAGSYTKIIHDFNLKPTKPCMDGEPRYEDHKIGWKDNNGCFNDYDARQAAYWSVFAGAHGHTYGHVNIWSFGPNNTACYDYDWRTAAARPGNGQMTHLHRLLKSVDQLKRVPDQSLIASGEGSGADHKRAMRASDGSYGFIYAPSGGSFSVNLNKLSGDMISAQWLDPREGTYRDAGAFSNSASRSFTAPGEKKRGNDWVLVLRDMSAVHPAAPGELTAVNATDTSVELQWSDNSDNEESFIIEVRRSGGVWSPLSNHTTNSTGAAVGGLSPETAYEFRVKAVNEGGSSDWSNIAVVTTAPVGVTGWYGTGSITFSVEGRGIVYKSSHALGSIGIYNIRGNLVNEFKAESERYNWDRRDANGDPVPSGLYILRISGTREIHTFLFSLLN